MNIRQLLKSRVRQHPKKAFVIFEDQVTSYTDFDTTVNRVASGFLRLGISAGDRVCVMLSNCPEFLYAWFGLMKIGAILVPINSVFRSTETQYIVQHAEAAAIVVDAATGPVVADIAAHLSCVCQRISLATSNLATMCKIGSMGKPARHPDPELYTRVRLLDDVERDVPVGQGGEVLLHSPGLMVSYYRDPDRTVEDMRDGWFHTGDYARQDEDGFFFCSMRKW